MPSSEPCRDGSGIPYSRIAPSPVPSAGLLDSFVQSAATHVPQLPVVGVEFSPSCALLDEFRRSDHVRFWDEGYRAIALSDTAEARNPHYHASTDVPATLDLDFARRVAQATLATIIAETGFDLHRKI